MLLENPTPNFEQAVLPHLDAAYNLARWLMRNERDAQDVAQEAYLRAFRFFPRFRGGDARAWLLKIVRNTCYTWLQTNRPMQDATEFDENLFPSDSHGANPEEAVLQKENYTLLRRALQKLPPSFREVIVLRELEGMSYREIADNHWHARWHGDVEPIACTRPPPAGSDSSYERTCGANLTANRGNGCRKACGRNIQVC